MAALGKATARPVASLARWSSACCLASCPTPRCAIRDGSIASVTSQRHRQRTLPIISRHFHASRALRTPDNNEAKEPPHYSLFDSLPPSDETKRLFHDLLSGSRRALAKSITLVESSRQDHQIQAQHLLSMVLAHNKRQRYGKKRSSFRIGFTGPPGVGKSTFIEAFGTYLLKDKHRKLAVLAIDPSSQRTGGSILGDKTRMEVLAAAEDAYVRPSPSRGALGGVARNTQEAILLCEGAGYDTIFVESVGVGQSEVILADMVDMYVLLVPPAGGDELQGIKRGVMELADLLIVNKADGELEAQATRTQTDYRSALMYLPPISPYWRPRAMRISALTKKGIPEVWNAMVEYQTIMVEKGTWDERRGQQNLKAMWRQISDSLLDRLKESEAVKDQVTRLETQVWGGEITAGRAADEVLGRFFGAGGR